MLVGLALDLNKIVDIYISDILEPSTVIFLDLVVFFQLCAI